MPLTKPEKVKAPELLAVVEAVDVPERLTAAPEPPVMVPEIEKVCAVAEKFTAVTLAPLTVTEEEAGLKVKPEREGVTV